MTYTPQRATFLLPEDHPDHPLQAHRRRQDAEHNQRQRTIEEERLLQATIRARPAWSPDMEQEMLSRKAEQTSQQPTDCLCEQLILLSAFTHELQMQAHLLHLNYVGSNFLAVHAFLKGRYETHIDQFDTIAEFVRALGKPMPATHAELLKILPAFEHAMSTAECQLSNYAENLAHQSCMATALESAAAEQRQIDVANYMAELVADAGKTRWFITATLS
jgi:DNA-binding ferritin-like protein